MRIILLILFFCGAIESNYDKVLIINYDHSTQIEGLPSPTIVNSTLLNDGFQSVYEMDYMGNSSFEEEQAGDKGAVLAIKTSNNPIIYKSAKEKSIYSVERILMEPYLVKDNSDIFKWEIKKVSRLILGYKCQMALMHYRGRDYKAYFTTDIPFNAGPWKFSGLPGTILKIESIDGVFKIMANKIEIRNQESEIKNPYFNKLKNAITWEDYILVYTKKAKEFQHYRDPSGGTRSLPKKNIEVYIEN